MSKCSDARGTVDTCAEENSTKCWEGEPEWWDVPESFLERRVNYWKPVDFESSGHNLKFYNDIRGEGAKRLTEPLGLQGLEINCVKNATAHIKNNPKCSTQSKFNSDLTTLAFNCKPCLKLVKNICNKTHPYNLHGIHPPHFYGPNPRPG